MSKDDKDLRIELTPDELAKVAEAEKNIIARKNMMTRKTKMKAIGKNIIVKKIETESTSSAGIIYTDTTRVTLAKVVAVGADVTTVNIDDELVINWSATIPVKMEEQYYIVNLDNVYAVK
jgi:co-chaperonin GroES (HSP10)